MVYVITKTYKRGHCTLIHDIVCCYRATRTMSFDGASDTSMTGGSRRCCFQSVVRWEQKEERVHTSFTMTRGRCRVQMQGTCARPDLRLRCFRQRGVRKIGNLQRRTAVTAASVLYICEVVVMMPTCFRQKTYICFNLLVLVVGRALHSKAVQIGKTRNWGRRNFVERPRAAWRRWVHGL